MPYFVHLLNALNWNHWKWERNHVFLRFTALVHSFIHSILFSSLLFPSVPFSSLPFPSLPYPTLHCPALPFASLPFPSLPIPIPLLLTITLTHNHTLTFTLTLTLTLSLSFPLTLILILIFTLLPVTLIFPFRSLLVTFLSFQSIPLRFISIQFRENVDYVCTNRRQVHVFDSVCEGQTTWGKQNGKNMFWKQRAKSRPMSLALKSRKHKGLMSVWLRFGLFVAPCWNIFTCVMVNVHHGRLQKMVSNLDASFLQNMSATHRKNY